MIPLFQLERKDLRHAQTILAGERSVVSVVLDAEAECGLQFTPAPSMVRFVEQVVTT
ncbi:MAG TPA: hypothetical protein VH601_21330 [Bryobacteraceae bacterium]